MKEKRSKEREEKRIEKLRSLTLFQSKELSIADTAKALVWADQIFVGYKKEYP
jgi:hypothetical protein